ncbi:hypothetical protein MKZ38_005959 [Zalerion maritima]|uniref:DUF7514 domain-containing protein n=1 Tax=Zalerion maritima TaxID=339359 RepID=A0AAD5RX44_9PEZI|nr:hypothetical protein MKZ38_005959 [Zalerion maritima]
MPVQALDMAQAHGSGSVEMNGPRPGPIPPQLGRWGIGPPESSDGTAVMSRNGETNDETEFELDTGSDANTGSKDYSTDSEGESVISTDEESEGEGEGEDKDEDEDEDENDDKERNDQCPKGVTQVRPTYWPATNSAQIPAGHTQPWPPRMQTESAISSNGLSPELMAEIKAMIHHEVVPCVVEKLQRSPSDASFEGHEIPLGGSTGRYASSIASSSAQTEPILASHVRPAHSPRGITAPNMPLSPPPSNASSFSPDSSTKTSPSLRPSQAASIRPVYRSNSSALVQPSGSALRNGLSSPTVQRPTVRFSDRAPPMSSALPETAKDDSRGSRSPRPADFSPIDSKWGVLFDPATGGPTPRLKIVFRGLARYLIDEIEPRNSIVVTAQKMAALYRTHSVENEPHGYPALFRWATPTANSALSELYSAIGAEYYLVPAAPRDPPTVPGLTPEGFATWFTTKVLAYPDEEASRLNRIFEAWPVNADGPLDSGKAERLPKMLGRHLLPKEPLLVQRGMFENGLQKFRESLKQTPKTERVTGAVLLAEKRSSAFGNLGGAAGSHKKASSLRAGRYSDDEQARRSAPSFSNVNYHPESREHRERKHSSPSNGESSGVLARRNSTAASRPTNSSTSTVVYAPQSPSEKGRPDLDRSPTRHRSPSRRRNSYRASEPDISYGNSSAYDKFPSSRSSVYHHSRGSRSDRKYYVSTRDKERDRETDKSRERDRERTRDYGRDRPRNRDRDRERNRDRDRDRERTRERERQRDREYDRESDKDSADYRLASSSSRKRSSVDATPRSDVGSRRRSEAVTSSEKANDSHGPTWNEISPVTLRGILKAATMDTITTVMREKHRN